MKWFTPSMPSTSEYPLRVTDTIRYADTDRQGHVNNAVFSSLLENGRVGLLYDPARPLAAPRCSFVIAKLTIDFLAELTWPGQVETATRVSKVGRSSVTLEQAIFQGGRCCATASSVIVQVRDETRKAEALEAAAVEALLAKSVEMKT